MVRTIAADGASECERDSQQEFSSQTGLQINWLHVKALMSVAYMIMLYNIPYCHIFEFSSSHFLQPTLTFYFRGCTKVHVWFLHTPNEDAWLLPPISLLFLARHGSDREKKISGRPVEKGKGIWDANPRLIMFQHSFVWKSLLISLIVG